MPLRSASARVAEHERAERCAVDRCRRRRRCRRRSARRCVEAEGSGRVDLVSDAVGVDHVGAALGEHAATVDLPDPMPPVSPMIRFIGKS